MSSSARGASIVLVGFMGTGKTAVGEALARRLGRRFIDTDALIEQRAGTSIATIFAAQGEVVFRAAEGEAVAAAARRRNAVIATGGGVMLDDRNVTLLRRAGVIICLTARPQVILSRVGDARERPLLAGAGGPLRRIELLMAERAPRYALADLILDTSDLPVDAVVDRICAEFESRSRPRPTISS